MKNTMVVGLSIACLALGAGIGYASSKSKAAGMDAIQGKPAKEAGLSALAEAHKLAGTGSWELIGVARVYYLSGDKAKGQAIIDQVLAGKTNASDWERIAWVYADAGENDKAEPYFQKSITADPKDDTGQAKVGAWYVHIGKRDKGEELFARALARNPDEVWHYVTIAEAFLNVPPR